MVRTVDGMANSEMSRLLRLLELIGTPASASATVDSTLLVLAEALRADVVCVASAVGQRIVPTAVAGPAADDLTPSWPLGPAAREALERSVAVRHSAVAAADRPPGLLDRPKISGAWVPLAGDLAPSGDLLLLFRGDAEPFSAGELQILTSVGYRIGTAVEALERATAIERLAAAGPGLARHVDLPSLLDEAVVLLRDLTGTDSAFIVIREDDLLVLATYTGVDESICPPVAADHRGDAATGVISCPRDGPTSDHARSSPSGRKRRDRHRLSSVSPSCGTALRWPCWAPPVTGPARSARPAWTSPPFWPTISARR